jgi:hypothetical protein
MPKPSAGKKEKCAGCGRIGDKLAMEAHGRAGVDALLAAKMAISNEQNAMRNAIDWL